MSNEKCVFLFLFFQVFSGFFRGKIGSKLVSTQEWLFFFGVPHQVFDPLRFHEKMLLQRLKFEKLQFEFSQNKKALIQKNKVFGVGGCPFVDFLETRFFLV